MWTRIVLSLEIHLGENQHLNGFPGGTVVKNLTSNAGEAGSIPGSGISPGEEMATNSTFRAWKIPRTEERGGLQ